MAHDDFVMSQLAPRRIPSRPLGSDRRTCHPLRVSSVPVTGQDNSPNVIFLTARSDESLNVGEQYEDVPQLNRVCQTQVREEPTQTGLLAYLYTTFWSRSRYIRKVYFWRRALHRS